MGKTRVLIADNNRFYTQLIGDHLRSRGFQVTEANSGAEALVRIDQDPPDLIVLDLIMPEIDGVQVCEYLQGNERLRAIAVIILSGILPEEIENLKRLGARAFVAKMQAEKVLEGIDKSIEWIQRGESEVFLEGFHSMHRREVVQELLEELRARNTLLASLSEGAAAVNAAGSVIYCNEVFARQLGLRPWEPLNRPVEECFSGDRDRVRTLLQDVKADPGSAQRLEISRPPVVLELRAAPLRREGGGGVVLLLEDVTARREAERERERLQHQLLQSEKLSALGRLISGVAHELNNPLTGVIGYSQLLLGRSEDARLKRQLERIYTQACRCQKIIQNLIVFGQKHTPIKRHLGLNGILRKVLEVMSLQLRLDGIEVETDLDPKLPLTMLDYDQMRQVFMNLINNAHQAMLQSPRRVLKVVTCARGQRIFVEFRDSGPGLPADQVDAVFEPFFTTREVGQGVGLGLSVSYSVVREHGGQILISNVPEGGALVTLELPVLAAEPGGRQSQAASCPDVPQLAPRVLVVDDEPVILDLMVDLLGERHFRVDTASNGREAMSKLPSGGYVAVVLDLKMPEMDGAQFFREIETRFPTLSGRVVFTTGDTIDEKTRKFLEGTGQPILNKPFEIDKVLQALQTVLSSEPSVVGAGPPATKF